MTDESPHQMKGWSYVHQGEEGEDEKRYETQSGRQFTGGELARMAMHGDAVERDGELHVGGERVRPVDSDTKEDSDGSDE